MTDELNDERLCDMFEQVNILISRVVALKQAFCYEDFNKIKEDAIDQHGEPKIRVLKNDKFITIGDFYKNNVRKYYYLRQILSNEQKLSD